MAKNKRFAGRRHTPETKEKMRRAHLGQYHTDATKKRIRATLRRQWGLIKQLEKAT